MKHMVRSKLWLIVGLSISGQAFGYYFYYAPNVDPKGRKLPTTIGIAVYRGEDRFKQFLKNQGVTDKSVGYIVKYGPIFGKIVGSSTGKVVQAGVSGETGSKGAGAAAGKATEVGIELASKGVAKMAQALSKPIKDLQKVHASNHYHGKMHVGRDEKKHPNPRCRDINSMNKAMKDITNGRWGLTEDEPRSVYVAIFNKSGTDPNVQGGKVDDILMNKWLIPMGPDANKLDPQTGTFYKGKGKARGGPFASWIIQTSYQETDVYEDGVPIKDDNGKLIIDPDTGDYVTEKKPVIDPATGKQKVDVRIVANLVEFHDRGGIDCSTRGKNPNNDQDQQAGALPTDTTEATLKGGEPLQPATVPTTAQDANKDENTSDEVNNE